MAGKSGREKSQRLTPNDGSFHKRAMATPLYASGVGHETVNWGEPKNIAPTVSSAVNDHLPKSGALLKSGAGSKKKGR